MEHDALFQEVVVGRDLSVQVSHEDRSFQVVDKLLASSVCARMLHANTAHDCSPRDGAMSSSIMVSTFCLERCSANATMSNLSEQPSKFSVSKERNQFKVWESRWLELHGLCVAWAGICHEPAHGHKCFGVL